MSDWTTETITDLGVWVLVTYALSSESGSSESTEAPHHFFGILAPDDQCVEVSAFESQSPRRSH